MVTYIIISIVLLAAELIYFRIADHFNIIDKPNERSSHSNIVLRGGGIIFVIALWIWAVWQMVQGGQDVQGVQGVQMVQEHWPLLVGVTLAAGISFVDDVHSLPDSVRLVCHFIAMFFVMAQIGLFDIQEWSIVNLVL